MTEKPTLAIDDSEGFNYETITGSAHKSSIDLNDKGNNDAITENIINTRLGRGRPFLAGKIVWDDSVSRYHLSHDASKDASSGLSYNPVSSATGSLDSSQWFDSNLSNRLYEHRDDTADVGLLGRDLDWESKIEDEVSAIQSSFANDNHNSYAYQVNRHPDFVQDGTPLLDIGSGPGIPTLNQQTGVWTTRIIQGNCNIRRDRSPHQKRKKVFGYWRSQSKHCSHPSGWPHKQGSSPAGVGKNHHAATSFMVKLNAPLDAGEYIPICMYNSIDRDVTSISENKSSATGWGVDVKFETAVLKNDSIPLRRRKYQNWNKIPIGWDVVSGKVASDTGTSVEQYSDNFLQWYNLTCNTLVDGRRNVHDMIVFLGKPYSNPNIHELVIWYAGGDGIFTPQPGHGWYQFSYKYYPSSVRKIEVTNSIETDKWLPIFIHHMTEKASSGFGDYGEGRSASQGHWKYTSPFVNTSNAGTPTFAFNGGIQDYDITKSVYHTSLDIGFQTYNCSAGIGNAPAVREQDSGTFLSFYATEKISVADLNYNINNTSRKSEDPTKAPLTTVRNPTYFPSATVTYEGVGQSSTLNDMSGVGWDNIENIKSADLVQEATVKGIGPGNALQVFVDTSTAPMNPSSIVKSISVDIRGLRKRFINPNLAFKIALYKNNNNPDESLDTGNDAQGNPVDERISEISSTIVLDSKTSIDTTFAVSTKLDGSAILYSDLDPGGTGTSKAYFKVWADE